MASQQMISIIGPIIYIEPGLQAISLLSHLSLHNFCSNRRVSPRAAAKEVFEQPPSLTLMFSQSKVVFLKRARNLRPNITTLLLVSSISISCSSGRPSPTSIATQVVPQTASAVRPSPYT